MRVTIDLTEEQAEALGVLFVAGSAPAGTLITAAGSNRRPAARDAIVELVDHAVQGVQRPGSWERAWLCQAFGDEWVGNLESDPDVSWRQRPRAR